MLDRLIIGKRIAKCRKKHGLTQAKFAEQLGFSEKHVCCIERGNVGLTTDLLSQIAEKLDIDVLSLLADADPGKPTYGTYDIQEIIKEWTPEQVELLISIANDLNKHFYA